MMRILKPAVFVLYFACATMHVQANDSVLDGTLWVYEHESGYKHYVAFFGNFHFLNSSTSGMYDDTLWLRSAFPYRYQEHFNGSVTYCATHIAPAAWAINWGRFDINQGTGSFNAAGMLCSIFIYNRNEPYKLVSANWTPPHVQSAGYPPSVDSLFISPSVTALFGE